MINSKYIERLLEGPAESDAEKLSPVLDEAKGLKGLSLEQAALLLKTEDPALLARIHACAERVKQRVFGNRIVLFAPLYLSNYCVNSCLYCGFKSGNKELPRRALTKDEAVAEARTLVAMGFKRVLLVAGEDKRYGTDYIAGIVRAIYKETGMRIIHVNAAPMDIKELSELKAAGVGVYQVFQETYHRPTYEKMHPGGPKKDYDYRINVMERAAEAGFEDLGIGTLLGLYDYRFDVLSTIAHSRSLFKRYGMHAHTISIPRLRPASGTTGDAEALNAHSVSDSELKKITAIYRLSVPTAGVVVTTREPEELRRELLHAGASQLSAASRTSPGGYGSTRPEQSETGSPEGGKDAGTLEQFSTNDQRSVTEVMATIIKEGGLPSLCTTCYRTGRVGAHFTELSSRGEMHKFCQANALLSLKEYTIDNPPNGNAELFNDALNKTFDSIKDKEIKDSVTQKLKALEKGKKDLYL
ncbi:[FeFe]-hydrogenase maturation protein HydG [hydrothermal vent metagenome]|uniref:[FeFe]-hydrogenase maturation protein HydG n=1 Tax=hydrothermal vent metagenome TaxID=652676 RepID=A0A3B0UVX7_9ZZZZ